MFHHRFFSRQGTRLLLCSLLIWGASLLVISGRALFQPERRSTVEVYQQAGEKWLSGERLYRKKRFGGYVYGPIVAAALVPYAYLSKTGATLLLGLLNAGVLAGAAIGWMRSGLYRGVSLEKTGWVLLLLFPLTVGNLNICQINPLLIGLIMLSILGCYRQHWGWAALALAVAVHLKIYPVAIGMLLAVLYPRRFTGRFVLAVGALGGVAFLLQDPSYVLKQYQVWMETRMAENRFVLEGEQTCRDLWLLLRFFGLPITESGYRILQVLSGGAIAGLLFFGRIKAWSEERLLVALFSLGSVWMVLLGPATESPTYVLLAPAVVFALVQAFSAKGYTVGMRAWIASVFLFLVVQLVLNAFFRIERSYGYMSIQPMGALLFLGYSLAALRRRYWSGSKVEDASALLPAEGVLQKQTSL